MKTFDPSLHLVLDLVLCGKAGIFETAQAAVVGGATMIQLRDKEADLLEMIEMGQALKKVLVGRGVSLIINDNVEAAIKIGADGVHVGQSDMAVDRARQLIGKDMILGLSVETVEQADGVDDSIVDYVGAGPIFATTTKPGHARPIGFHGLEKIAHRLRVPVVAIGGLKAEHVFSCFAAGAKGLAVASAICGRPNPEEATREIALAISRVKGENQ